MPNQVPAGGRGPATASEVARALCQHLREGAVPQSMMPTILDLLKSFLEPPPGCTPGAIPEAIVPGNELISLLAALHRQETSVYTGQKIKVDESFYLAATKCLKRALLTTQITSAPTA